MQELHNALQALQDTLREFPGRYQVLGEELFQQGVARQYPNAILDGIAIRSTP